MSRLWQWAERGMAGVGVAALAGAAGYFALSAGEPPAASSEVREVFFPSPRGQQMAQHIARINAGEGVAACVDEIYVYPTTLAHVEKGQGQGRLLYTAPCRPAQAGFAALKIIWQGERGLGFTYSMGDLAARPETGVPPAVIAVETRIAW